MTETPEEGQAPKRMGPPFPSRRELHGSRIPRRPDDAPDLDLPAKAPDAGKNPDVQDVQKEQSSSEMKTSIPKVVPTSDTPKASSVSQRPQMSRRELHANQSADVPTSKPTTEQAELVETLMPAAEQAKKDQEPPRRSNNSGKKRSKKKKKKGWTSALIIILVLAVIGGAVWWAVSSIPSLGSRNGSVAFEDYAGTGTESVQVQIVPGETGYEIGQSLYEAGVVKSIGAFTTVFESNAAASSIRPGTYTLRKEMPAADALAMLLDESNRVDNTVTVIPGQTVAQIEQNLIEVSSFSEDEVKAAFADVSALGLPSVANGNLEGWLFPGSYEIATDSTVATLLSSMVKDTVDFLKSKDVPEDKWEKVLTEASIVEREVAWPDHMPQVARVVENRLSDPEAETRGKLQMDSTVLYGVGKNGGVPTAADIEDDNPYNTYLHQGLPPSPIASPSATAIDAVLNPDDGDWLYFVTVNLDTGETLFANTLAEQQANTEKFMQWCEENAGKC